MMLMIVGAVVIMWDFRPHNMFCYHFNSLNVFGPDHLRSSPSSTGCALPRWKKKNSSSKDKQQSPWLIALRRGESKPYCWHQEVSDVMVMSMALIVNRTHRHTDTHARAASQLARGSVSVREEKKTAKGGQSVLEERAADRGWLWPGRRQNKVCVLSSLCQLQIWVKIRLYFPNSCWTVDNVSGMCLSWKEFGI